MINGDTAFFDGKPDGDLTKYIKTINKIKDSNNTYSAILETIKAEGEILSKLRVRKRSNEDGLER